MFLDGRIPYKTKPPLKDHLASVHEIDYQKVSEYTEDHEKQFSENSPEKSSEKSPEKMAGEMDEIEEMPGVTHVKFSKQQETKKLKCSFCDKYFFGAGDLSNHLKEVHEAKGLSIDLGESNRIDLNFSSQEKVSTSSGSRKKPHQCLICFSRFDQIFARDNCMVRHQIRKKIYKCFVCSLGFNRIENFLQHMDLKCGKLTNSHYSKAENCEVSQSKKKADEPKIKKLENQQKSDNDPKRDRRFDFKCLICMSFFKSEDTVKRHAKIVHKG